MSGDLVLFSGGTVKELGKNKFGGYGILFTSENDPDLDGEFFDARSEFWLEDRLAVPTLYSHGKDEVIGKLRLGTSKWTKNEDGIYFEGWFDEQLAERNRYIQEIMKLIRKGALGFSSAAVPQFVEKIKGEAATWIKTWPVYELSLTPTPCEPRTSVALKSYRPISLKEAMRRGNLSPFDLERERTRRLMLQAMHDAPEDFSEEDKQRWGYYTADWTRKQVHKRGKNLEEFGEVYAKKLREVDALKKELEREIHAYRIQHTHAPGFYPRWANR